MASEGQPAKRRTRRSRALRKTAPPLTPGASFVFGRWSETLDPEAPFWARSDGIGLRLRLDELIELARANQVGGIAVGSLESLRDEAARELCSRDGYCYRRFRWVAERIRGPLQKGDLSAFVPDGVGPSAVRAAKEHLGEHDIVEYLVTDIAADAISADDPAAFTQLGRLVELLDSELAYEGHSREWRRRVCSAAEKAAATGKDTHAALEQSLEAAERGVRRSYDALVPLSRLVEPPSGRSGIDRLPVDDALEIMRDWESPEVLGRPLGEAYAKFPAIEAPDQWAAAETVEERLRRASGLWRLRGGQIEPLHEVFLFSEGKATIAPLPMEDLRLLPPNLDAYELPEAEEEDRPHRLDNALAQLAQASGAFPAAGLADVWSTAEIAFGGALGDPRHQVAGELADLAAAIYPASLFDWLARRVEAAGVDLVGPEAASVKLLRAADADPDRLLTALRSAGDELARVRLARLTQWRTDALGKEMQLVRGRMQRVASRAYLMRNLVLHRGESRMAALTATYPAFAELVRACLGHVLALGSTWRHPLAGAKLTVLQTDRVSADALGGVDLMTAFGALLAPRE